MAPSTKLLLALSLLAAPADAARLDEILAEMKEAGDRLETLTADFEQTDHDFILQDQEASNGKLYLQKPGRIRWEYGPPSTRVLLVKDDLVRVYTPSAAQVHEMKQKEGSNAGGAGLLVGFGGNDKIAENYDATLVEETDRTVVLKLVPKPDSAASLFVAIELTLDKKTWTPTQSVFHEVNKDRTEIDFKNVVINGKLPDRIFELDLPANVEIIRNP